LSHSLHEDTGFLNKHKKNIGLKLAAIDIGSNAVRLLICNVLQKKNKKVSLNKELLVRAPIRLGEQSFLDGEIFENKIVLLSKACSAFKNLMEIYGVEHFKTFATSAMREAKNHDQIVDRIKAETGVEIDVVPGKKEAEIIYFAFSDLLSNQMHDTFLNIDVGGGSTEFVIFHNGKVVENRSFKIGTLRVLNGIVKDSSWGKMKEWLEKISAEYDNIYGLGSGGNIVKIHKLFFDNINEAILPKTLKEIKEELDSFTVRERMINYDIKSDRADVIAPAAEIFTKILEWGKIKRLFVPKIGLSDGIIREVYNDYLRKKGEM